MTVSDSRVVATACTCDFLPPVVRVHAIFIACDLYLRVHATPYLQCGDCDAAPPRQHSPILRSWRHSANPCHVLIQWPNESDTISNDGGVWKPSHFTFPHLSLLNLCCNNGLTEKIIIHVLSGAENFGRSLEGRGANKGQFDTIIQMEAENLRQQETLQAKAAKAWV